MFVDRNEQGRIVAIYANPQREGHEWVEGASIEPDPKQVIIEQITAIESTITQRRIREAALGIDGGWLAQKDAEIAELRKSI